MMRITQDTPVSIQADEEKSSSLLAGVSAITGDAQDWLEDAAGKIENLVTNRPALALGAALAAGVFLGWLIKRR
jgi:ElaB/YqjD/DUF883 family membrane-anchored ribosome-binding protein